MKKQYRRLRVCPNHSTTYNRWLRWAAVEAVYPGMKADFDIKSFYNRLKKRKGPNPAKVATARRMLTIIYRMLKENRLYIPYKR